MSIYCSELNQAELSYSYVEPWLQGISSASNVRTSGGVMPLKDDDCGDVRGLLERNNDEKPTLYLPSMFSPQRNAREDGYVRISRGSDPSANQPTFTHKGVAGSFGKMLAGQKLNRNSNNANVTNSNSCDAVVPCRSQGITCTVGTT